MFETTESHASAALFRTYKWVTQQPMLSVLQYTNKKIISW